MRASEIGEMQPHDQIRKRIPTRPARQKQVPQFACVPVHINDRSLSELPGRTAVEVWEAVEAPGSFDRAV